MRALRISRSTRRTSSAGPPLSSPYVFLSLRFPHLYKHTPTHTHKHITLSLSFSNYCSLSFRTRPYVPSPPLCFSGKPSLSLLLPPLFVSRCFPCLNRRLVWLDSREASVLKIEKVDVALTTHSVKEPTVSLCGLLSFSRLSFNPDGCAIYVLVVY